jgi:hypothetical protein
MDFSESGKTGDWDWHRDHGRPRVFLAHSESNIGLSHMLNAAFSACARYHGHVGAVMQHGIWLEEFAQPVAFASQRLLAWGSQHTDFFREPGVHCVAGKPATPPASGPGSPALLLASPAGCSCSNRIRLNPSIRLYFSPCLRMR